MMEFRKKELRIKNHIRENQLFRSRLWVTAVITIGLFSILCIRLFYLQLFNHEHYTTLSQKNILSLIPIPPNRGLIYDRHGVILADNTPVFNLTVMPNRIKNLDDTIHTIRKYIAISNDDIKIFNQNLSRYHSFDHVPLRYKLTEEEVARFYVNQYQLPGVSVRAELMRYYPQGPLMAHAVGYVGRISPQELKDSPSSRYLPSDYYGKNGIEKYYEPALRGELGTKIVETNARGKMVRLLDRVLPQSGNDVYLTIDVKLQALAYDALGEESGAVIAMNPQNGQILAFVSKPSFDPNIFVTGLVPELYHELFTSPSHPLYNRIIQGQFPSASTIKPFYALLGLDRGVITTQTSLYDPGWFKLPNSAHVYHDWKKGGHGTVDVFKAIMMSCDIFFYTLAVKSGIEVMHAGLTKFGFGSPTGIDLNGELSGNVPSPEWKMKVHHQPWFPGDTVNAGIGQGYILVTPLQLLNGVSTIANRGIHPRPHLLLKFKDSHHQVIRPQFESSSPVVLDHPEVWETVIQAMQAVIKNEGGTAYWTFGRNFPYTIAAKTGTAQVIRKKDDHTPNSAIPKEFRDNDLFITFAPVEKPQIALMIIVEHTHKSASIARKIIDYYLLEEHHLKNTTETKP